MSLIKVLREPHISYEQIEKLVSSGSNVRETSAYEETPLELAICSERIEIVELLIDSGAGEKCYTNRISPLSLAIRRNSTSIAELIIRKRIGIDDYESDLHTAISLQNTKITKILLELGVRMHCYQLADCPLLLVIKSRYFWVNINGNRRERLKIAEMLLQLKVEPAFKKQAIEEATKQRFTEMVELIENWPNINTLENMCKRVIYTNREIIPEWFPPLLLGL